MYSVFHSILLHCSLSPCFSRGMMYWSDVANEVIMQSKLDGTDVRTIVNTGLIEPGIRND